jgi:hypothetical protein
MKHIMYVRYIVYYKMKEAKIYAVVQSVKCYKLFNVQIIRLSMSSDSLSKVPTGQSNFRMPTGVSRSEAK